MSIVPPSMFRYNFGGEALPEYEASSHEATYYVTVIFKPIQTSWDGCALMKFMVKQIANGKAFVTEEPVQNISPLCISLPVYGFDDAAAPLVLASALSVARSRLQEIEAGFIVIDKDRLFRSD
ncbi:hypothetical protein N7541_005064 [Penicillium brevicompactum]|uniref:Uncharacterized protein n=1 Tax=Penicillium brevicompactum TaxID=5074 RepID=A0A9W9RD92_PENBR|nr:hypothetical protein N7541_005064 [Penicillium brevicompactum]